LLAALHGFSSDAMFEARRILEVSLAGLAAERATDEHLAMMAEAVADTYASLNDPKLYLAYDMQFHRAVALASGNPIIATLIDMVMAALYEMKVQTIEHATDMRESAAMHRNIYQAIRAHRPDEAREAMKKHLDLAEKAFITEEAAKRRRSKATGQGTAATNGGSRSRASSRKTRA
jgi:GntR family transcriptional repressor for pyruvate dehydrogenase complex